MIYEAYAVLGFNIEHLTLREVLIMVKERKIYDCDMTMEVVAAIFNQHTDPKRSKLLVAHDLNYFREKKKEIKEKHKMTSYIGVVSRHGKA